MNKVSTKTRRQLETVEQEIRETTYEAFFYVGQRLLEIRRDRLYEQAGYTSWSKYCAAGRIEFRKAQADQYIRASDMRPKLPRLLGNAEWTVHQVLELAKCETDNDAKRVAKKVIAEAKRNNGKVTAKLIAQTRDGETSKPARALDQASLEVHLDKLASIFLDWRRSLEQIDLEQWDSVPADVMTRVTAEGDALLSFLRS